MKIEKRDFWIYLITLVFFMTELFILLNILKTGKPSWLLWFCYIAIPLVIFGLIKRNPYIILSQAIIIAIPDIFWTIDFFSQLFFGHTILGISAVTGFPFEDATGKIASLFHLYTLPLLLVALYLIKIRKNIKVLFASLLQVTVLFFLSLLTPSSQEINCVKGNCFPPVLTFIPHDILWFILVFGFIIISYFIITSLPFVKPKKN